MRGIYVHIPFCKQACRYCDFFFSVRLHYQDQFTDCLLEEIRTKGRTYGEEKIESLYLGGGTPSLLSLHNLKRIMVALAESFDIQDNAEITIECNPDDLDSVLLDQLRSSGFNRISIGVQSFRDSDLQLMKRAHSGREATEKVILAADAGFTNINIDLIYGIPGLDPEQWVENLDRAIRLPITHLSAYHLTFEEGTLFNHWRKKGRLVPVTEETSLSHYRSLQEIMRKAGFIHYEVSNFAANNLMSAHNLIYWKGEPYLGIGPSAHSYNGNRRWWNVASLKKYMEGIRGGRDISEAELLSVQDHYHDYLITALRTSWGADPAHIRSQFGLEHYDHFFEKAEPFMKEGILWSVDNRVAIHPDHWMITDQILRKLFLD